MYETILNTTNRGRRLVGPRWINPAHFGVDTPDRETNRAFAQFQDELESRLSLPFGLKLMKSRWLQSTEEDGASSAIEASLAAHFIKWYDPDFALKIIEPFFDNQSSEGIIPSAVMPLSISSKPASPFIAEVILRLSRLSHSNKLADHFERLEHFSNWLILHKKESDGMFIHADKEWFAEDPYIHHIRSERPDVMRTPHDVRSVALNSMMVFQMQCMAQMARALKLDKEARRHEESAKQLRDIIAAKLWNEEKGFFFDSVGDAQVQTASLMGFLPLAADVPTKGQAARMAGYLPQMLDRLNILIQQPGVAPIFLLVADGLGKYGYRKEASSLAFASVNYIRSLGKAKKYFLPRLVAKLLLVRNIIGFHQFDDRYVLNPCLPDEWKNGPVGIRVARNSHIIYMTLKDSQKVECSILSSAGEQVSTTIDNYAFKNFPFPIESIK